MTDAAGRLTAALAGRYAIERELGAGGMATVYLAQDLRHDRQVAIKVLRPELAAVLGAERFVVEIKTTAALQHPHILPLFDSGSADGFLYYVMPYVEGETLRARLDREKQLGIDEAVKITTEVADALDYAHRHGVVHRDIKPENILLHDGRPMVADFGIALAVSAAAGGRMTETGLSLGTPHYMSPEQATAEKEITGRSDVYSLGCVLYEMLTGNPPHVGASAQQIIMKIIAEPVAEVTSLRKSVPPGVAAALSQALQKLPADRFDSARAFAGALNDPSFSFFTGGGPGRRASASRRTERRVAAAAMSAALVAVGAAGVWIGSRTSSGPPTVATVAIELAPGDDLSAMSLLARQTNADRPVTTVLAYAPDGRTLVFAGQRDGRRSLFRRSIATGETTRIAGTDSASEPFFSPDGRTIGFWAHEQLQRVPLEGGTPVQLAPVARPGGASWGDGGWIVYANPAAGTLLRVPAAGGGAPEPLPAPRGAHLPWVLPGGRAVLYTVAYGGNFTRRRIEALDLKSGRRTTVLDNAADARYLANGYLAFARVGQLMVVPFDPSTLRVTGAAVGVLPDVMQAMGATNTQAETDAAQYTVSRHGDLAWLAGGITPATRDRWFIRDAGGRVVPVDLPEANYEIGRFAPDGREIAISSARPGASGIWIVDPAHPGGARQLVATAMPLFAWSPDGTHVVAGWDDSLVVVATAGGSAPVTIAGVSGQYPSQWLAGDTVLTVVTATRDWQIAEVPVRGGTPRIVLEEPGRLEYPTVSPDGRWLAYAATEGSRENVVLRRWPSLAGRRVVAPGSEPAWTRGGGELWFVGDSDRVMAVAVGPDGVTGQPHEVEPQAGRISFPIRSSDVSADGQRYLYRTRAPVEYPPAPVIHLTLGWFSQLAGAGR